MNKMIEAVLNDKDVKIGDYFNLINYFDCALLNLNGGNMNLSMEINAFQEIHKGFEFSQKCTDTRYAIREADIKSVGCKLFVETDSLQISIDFNDGSKAHITIYKISTNIKTSEQENYYEINVDDLKEYLANKCNEPTIASVRDMNGLNVRISPIKRVYVSEGVGCGNLLHISDNLLTSIVLPLAEDSCNEIYMKHEDSFDNVLIKPYGQSFLEILLVFNKVVSN